MNKFDKINQDRLKIIKPFIKELSVYLNRSEEEILSDGLNAGNFKGDVKLVYEDGSNIFYKYAFMLKNKTQVGVFTEHCGYHVYDLEVFETVEHIEPSFNALNKKKFTPVRLGLACGLIGAVFIIYLKCFKNNQNTKLKYESCR